MGSGRCGCRQVSVTSSTGIRILISCFQVSVLLFNLLLGHDCCSEGDGAV